MPFMDGTFGELLNLMAHAEKRAVVDAATLAGGGGGGGDPMAAAGGDPMAAAGGDPMAAAGGAGAPAGGTDPALESRLAALEAQLAAGAGGAGGAAGGGVEPIKPKIDVNTTLLQILKILAKISDAMGIPMQASELVATQDDLTQFGMQQQAAGGGGVTGGGGGGGSAIKPVAAMQGASPGMAKASDLQAHETGRPYADTNLSVLGTRASALGAVLAAAKRS